MSYDITKLPCGCYENLGKYYPVCAEGIRLYDKVLECMNDKHKQGLPFQKARDLYNEHFCDIGDRICKLFSIK